MTEDRKHKFTTANMVLLVLVFLSIASISALIAWAGAVAEDTAGRRLISIPSAQISVTANDIAAKLSPDAIQNSESTMAGNSTGKALPIEAAPAPKETENPKTNKILWKNFVATYNRADSRPKIALIVSELGLMPKVTDRAITELPGAVTLAFSPYGTDIKPWMKKARALNHELLMQLPMEPLFYPNSDPGPWAILASKPWEDNGKQMDLVSDIGESYVGYLAYMGGKFLSIDGAMRPLLEDVKKRGLIFIDNNSTPGSIAGKIAGEIKSPFAAITVSIDADPAKALITAKLQELEAQAKANGYAIGLARNYPVSVDAIKQWSADLDARGLALVPISAMLDSNN